MCIMNMPQPMNRTFQDCIDSMHPAYVNTAEHSMNNAALQLSVNQDSDNDELDNITNIDVSVAGRQRRGYASLNGAVTVIGMDNGKCIAYDCMAKTCKSCQFWDKKKGTEEYDNFTKTHECPVNHTGSAGAMEAEGVVRCFQKSVESRKLRYVTYIGDGDSKAYSSVLKANPYPGVSVSKGECIGHIQKRAGSRLCRLKKEYGKKLLSDLKSLGGNGRLADKQINKLQNYFGIAI